MPKFESDINNGDLVYLITDLDQTPRLVISIEFCIDNGILYKTVSGTNTSTHYRKEISKTKNIELALGIQNN